MSDSLPKPCWSEEDVDLTSLSYEDWVRYVFNNARFMDHDVCYSEPERLVEYLIRACKDFASIGKRFSQEEIESAIWFLLGAAVEFGKCLLLTEVPLQKRLACLRAMYHPFADYLAVQGEKYSGVGFYMWWDLIVDNCFHREEVQADWGRLVVLSEKSEKPLREAQLLWEQIYRNATEDKRAVLDCTLEVLIRILHIDSLPCQGAALHGLGHLRHPRRAAVVQEYIEANRHIWSDNVECLHWLRHCRDGVVM